MHSSSPKVDSNKNRAVKSEIYYTTEDVQFLHEVVVYAQDLLPGLPERERVPTNALFTAYYALLPNIGVDADHDSRYARVLFKVGGTRSAGSLFEKFRAVLSQMGIELVFDESPEGYLEVDTAVERVDQVPSVSSQNPEIAVSERTHGRHRRNSEGSIWEFGNQTNAQQHSRTRSQSARVRPVSGVFTTSRRMSLSSTVNSLEHHLSDFGQLLQGQAQGQDNLSTLNPADYHRTSPVKGTLTHGSLRIRHRSPQSIDFDSKPTLTWNGFYDEEAAPSILARTSPISKQVDSDIGYSRVSGPNSDTLMDIKISLLGQYRAKALLRHAFLQWRQISALSHQDNLNLERLAAHQDKQVLVRQALDSWHINLQTRRQIAETERFFAHVEARADRARTFYILSKAFLHWADSAFDESLRTSAARRHILRTRYFEAWRGLTAINELKVRRLILRKFFALWRNRYHGETIDDMNSLVRYEGNLVYRVLWTWFRARQEGEASAWFVERIKRNKVKHWIKTTDGIWLSQALASDHDRRRIASTAYLAWTARLRERVNSMLGANDHHRRSLRNKVLRQFSLEISLSSPARRLRTLVSLRLKRHITAHWLERTRQERLAGAIDHLKVKLEAWTAWNNKFRCNVITENINQRILLQGLRAWILSERVILSGRLLDRRLAQHVLYLMSSKAGVATENEIRNLNNVHDFACQKLAARQLIGWRGRWQYQIQQQSTASDFNSLNLLENSLARWTYRTQQHFNLQKWAQDAEFYFLASKTLKLWKDTTENAKREKRRIAYVTVRRMNKLNLAMSMMSRWRQQTESAGVIGRLSVEFRYDKTIIRGVEAIDRWKGRVDELGSLRSAGKLIHLRKRFREMKSVFSVRQDLGLEAVALFSEQNLRMGVKMWARAALHLRASQHVLSEVREKWSRKTLRRIVLHWRERTCYMAALLELDQQDMEAGFGRSKIGATESIADWSSFGADPDIDELARSFDDETPHIAVPGYLSTPSKRWSRARLTRRLSSTTPAAPLSTDFENRLRAQYAGESISTFRRSIGRSMLGNDREALDNASTPKVSSRRERVS